MTDQPVSRPGTEWILGAAIALAATVAAILVIVSSPPATAGALFQSSDSEFVDLYAQQCAACHGDNGEGGVGGALTESSLDVPERIAVITNGQGGMPAYGPTLSATQIEGLAAYLDGFAVVEIYAAQCAPCHGSAGEGGVGPDLRQSLLTDADRYSIIAEGLGAMPGYSLTLSADELQAITDYVAAFVDSSSVGEEIWTSQCAPCHGAAGEGGVAPSIQDATTPFNEIVLITTNGIGGMPAYGPTLSTAEIEAVSRYVEGLRTDAPDPGTPPTNEAGAAGYAANCAACHGADGAGASGPAVSGTSLTNEELVDVIANGRGTMPGYSASLGADEIESIAQFVADLGNAPRTEGPSPIALGAVVYGENCASCHGVDASGASGPALKNSTLTTEELESAIVNGFGGMAGFGDAITGDHLTATVAYLEARIAAEAGSTDPDPTTPPDTTAAPDPVDTTDSSGLVDAAGGLQTGAEVYLGRCASCHGANGEGGVGSSLLNIDLDEDEIISRVYGGHENGMPAFDGVLDPDEVRNVARYVAALEGDETDSGGGPGRLLAGALLVLVVGGGFWLWRSGWMSRTNRTGRARES